MIENELHNTRTRHPKTKNFRKDQYKTINPLEPSDIIIKRANNDSAIVVMDKSPYTQEGDRKLGDTDFYEETQGYTWS